MTILFQLGGALEQIALQAMKQTIFAITEWHLEGIICISALSGLEEVLSAVT
jgi:hypothetical protein